MKEHKFYELTPDEVNVVMAYNSPAWASAIAFLMQHTIDAIMYEYDELSVGGTKVHTYGIVVDKQTYKIKVRGGEAFPEGWQRLGLDEEIFEILYYLRFGHFLMEDDEE